jgi:hypothetical protein
MEASTELGLMNLGKGGGGSWICEAWQDEGKAPKGGFYAQMYMYGTYTRYVDAVSENEGKKMSSPRGICQWVGGREWRVVTF